MGGSNWTFSFFESKRYKYSEYSIDDLKRLAKSDQAKRKKLGNLEALGSNPNIWPFLPSRATASISV